MIANAIRLYSKRYSSRAVWPNMFRSSCDDLPRRSWEDASDADLRYWRDVARFAAWWHAYVGSLDTATRYEARYSR